VALQTVVVFVEGLYCEASCREIDFDGAAKWRILRRFQLKLRTWKTLRSHGILRVLTSLIITVPVTQPLATTSKSTFTTMTHH